MKIQHLRFLTAVVDYGGVIKAAEHLHLSQPSISAGLKALELAVGRALFVRSTQGSRALRLTPAGRRLYRHALEILRLCEAARTDVVGEADEPRRIGLGVLDTLPQEAIFLLLRVLREQDASINLDLWEGSGDRVARWFAQGRLDFAWTNIHDFTVNARVLWREPLVAVVGQNHPFAKARGPISIRDLAGEPFVHRSRCELDAMGRAQLKAAAVKLTVRARAESEALVFQLVRSEGGITLAPESLVPDDLVALPVSGLTVERTIGLQWKAQFSPALLATVIDAAEAVVSMMSAKKLARKKPSKNKKPASKK